MERILRLLDEVDSIVIAIRLACLGQAGRVALSAAILLVAVVAVAVNPLAQLACAAMATTYCAAELCHRAMARLRLSAPGTA